MVQNLMIISKGLKLSKTDKHLINFEEFSVLLALGGLMLISMLPAVFSLSVFFFFGTFELVALLEAVAFFMAGLALSRHSPLVRVIILQPPELLLVVCFDDRFDLQTHGHVSSIRKLYVICTEPSNKLSQFQRT